MKKILFLIILLPSLVVTGCKGFLEEDPPAQLSKVAIYRTEGGMESAVNGIYDALRNNLLLSGDIFEYLGNTSGLQHWKAKRTTLQFTQSLDLCYAASGTESYNAYQRVYVVVNRANDVIENAAVSPLDDGFKTELVAEARMLRAYAYFFIARMWGDAPLVTVSPKTLDEAFMKRTSYLEIYRQILEDLEFAETHMRDAATQERYNPGVGRPNRWAATAVKAKVYVQIGSILGYHSEQEGTNPFRVAPDFTNCGIASAADAWGKALNTCQTIINQGPYQLAPNFAQLFRWGGHYESPGQYSTINAALDYNLKERILVLNLTNSDQGASAYVANRSMPNSPTGASNNWGRLRPSRMLFQNFCRDNGGVLTSTDGTTSGTSTRGDNLILYETCPDPRLGFSFYYGRFANRSSSSIPWGAQVNATGTTAVNCYPYSGVVQVNSPADATAQPYYRKYDEPRYNGGRGNADIYLIRYADIYLMGAEAAAELSAAQGDANWNQALQYIEVIHQRARRSKLPTNMRPADYLGDVPAGLATEATYPSWAARTFASKEAFIDAIFWERMYELTGELHEWFDVRRKGTAFLSRNLTTPLNAFLAQPAQQPLAGGDATTQGCIGLMYNGNTYKTSNADLLYRMLNEFPTREINANAALSETADQNRYSLNR